MSRTPLANRFPVTQLESGRISHGQSETRVSMKSGCVLLGFSVAVFHSTSVKVA
jgi:hypothetical protein